MSHNTYCLTIVAPTLYTLPSRVLREMANLSISVDTVIRGYHVYKDIWTAAVREILVCRRETDNLHDRFALAVCRGGDIVGHVPKKISSICSVFLRSGTINCEVTGSRQYSSDLEQGGLEISCKLNFSCNDQERLSTTCKLLDLAFLKECRLRNINQENQT